jgi:HD-GYP domain-containing protein (c-di-GMP phosphodiesterase class II)
MQEVILGSGTQFDPTIVQAFLSVLQREGHEFLERREPERVAPLAPPSFARYRGLGG